MNKNKSLPDSDPISQDATRARIDIAQVITGDLGLSANLDSGAEEQAETLGGLRTPD